MIRNQSSEVLCSRVGATCLAAALSLVAACAGVEGPPGQGAVDLIVLNADVYTSDLRVPRGEAFAVRDGRFILVGSVEEVSALAGAVTDVIDAGGATIIPGLIDGHTHLVAGSQIATGVDLSGVEGKDEWLRIIAEKAASTPEGAWILGGAWDHNLSDGVLPTKEMLDSVAPNHPVLLRDIDLHTHWANSLAIELAGVTADTAVPPGAEVMVDASGELTGIFTETVALFADAPGMREATDTEGGIRAAIALANSLGITGVHDMSGSHDEFLAVLESGDLTLRIWQGLRSWAANRGDEAGGRDPATQFRAAAKERERVRRRVEAIAATDTTGPLFEVGYAKLMVDGVLSIHTALLKAPYADRPLANPEPFVSKERLIALVAAAHDSGFPVAIHAVGDEGVSWALDAFAASPARELLPDRVEHVEVVTSGDVVRFGELSVIASMQPYHATCCVGNYVIDRIGRDRLPDAYGWRTFLDHGVTLVFGSDWATSPFSPLTQIAAAMTRETRIEGVVRPWDDANTLTFDEALYAYTQASADVTSWGDEVGSITEGKWADFVILDRTLSQPTGDSVAEAGVTATYLAGSQVYP